jgi:hypothetical protein
MYRLIYFSADNNYYTFDSDDIVEMDAKDQIVKDHRFDVICVVDYKRQQISKKCLEYAKHRDLIEHLIFDPMFVSNE